MKVINKKTIVMFVLFQLLFSSIKPLDAQLNQRVTLILKTSGGGVRPDYGLFISNYLEELNIDVIVKVEEWPVFIHTLIETHDFDLVIIGLSGGGASPDMYAVYGENGTLNMFGLDTNMPYGNDSENMMIEGVTITDLELRQQHYYEWQQLMMNKLVPMLPLYTPQTYVATWSNTNGYDARWGIIDSLPYLEFNGLHYRQNSMSEFRLADANWRDLNPLQSEDTSSAFVFNLLSEPIVGWSPDLTPLKTSLVENWEQIDEYHYKFTMRSNIFWNPSYNITERSAASLPLDTLTTPLMTGLKSGEVSYGNNQQVTGKDAVFSYLAYANPLVSEDTSYHEWISKCYVDPINPLAFHIEIDGDPETPENEQYVDFWSKLSWNVLPEFFLNSSDSTISYTSGGAECRGFYTGIADTEQWVAYSNSAFGCGKYQLDYYIRNSVTVLQASPYWMNIGVKDGTPQDLDIETVIIRVIPDISAELAEFKEGDLDWTSLTSFPTERKEMEADSDFTVSSYLSASFSFMAFNLRRDFIGGLNNERFLVEPGKEEFTVGCAIRKAICYAINRTEMNQELHQGDYLITNSVIYPYTAYYYYDDIIKYDYNLELAKLWLSYAEDVINPTTSTVSINLGCFVGIAIFLVIVNKKKNNLI